MAGSRKKSKPAIGNRSRLSRRQMSKLIDKQTGEFIANVRWRRCGHLFIEPAAHVRVKVVPDPKA